MQSDDSTSPTVLCEHGLPIPPSPRPRAGSQPAVMVCCSGCGGPEWRKASHAARATGAVFCSTACKAAAQSTVGPRDCAYCGKEFTPTAQQVRLGRGKTCSYECRGLSQQHPGDTRCSACSKLMPYRSGVRARRLSIQPMCRSCANSSRAVDPRVRFENLRDLPCQNGCRNWLGSHDTDNYGIFHITSTWQVAASRYAYCIAANISIENLTEEQFVCHTCDNPGCTQNAGGDVYFVFGVPYTSYGHLFLANAKINALDKSQKDHVRW
jgi:hypothetical protein